MANKTNKEWSVEEKEKILQELLLKKDKLKNKYEQGKGMIIKNLKSKIDNAEAELRCWEEKIREIEKTGRVKELIDKLREIQKETSKKRSEYEELTVKTVAYYEEKIRKVTQELKFYEDKIRQLNNVEQEQMLWKLIPIDLPTERVEVRKRDLISREKRSIKNQILEAKKRTCYVKLEKCDNIRKRQENKRSESRIRYNKEESEEEEEEEEKKRLTNIERYNIGRKIKKTRKLRKEQKELAEFLILPSRKQRKGRRWVLSDEDDEGLHTEERKLKQIEEDKNKRNQKEEITKIRNRIEYEEDKENIPNIHENRIVEINHNNVQFRQSRFDREQEYNINDWWDSELRQAQAVELFPHSPVRKTRSEITGIDDEVHQMLIEIFGPANKPISPVNNIDVNPIPIEENLDVDIDRRMQPSCSWMEL